MPDRRPTIFTVLEKALTLGFLSFVLWMFAQHFDETEVWAIIVYATGGGVYMSVKAAWPTLRTIILRGMAPPDDSGTTDNRAG